MRILQVNKYFIVRNGVKMMTGYIILIYGNTTLQRQLIINPINNVASIRPFGLISGENVTNTKIMSVGRMAKEIKSKV